MEKLMRKQIIKRNGSVADYAPERIKNAILKAYVAEKKDCPDVKLNVMMDKIQEMIFSSSEPSIKVEEIQDIVERVLLTFDEEIAHAYMTYRQSRSRARNVEDDIFTVLRAMDSSKPEENDIKRENANVNGDTAMGTMLKFGSVISKSYAERYATSPRFTKAHREGDIHIHDEDFLAMGTTTCTQIDLMKLFDGGFNTGHGGVRTPNDIATYAALACIAIQSNQNDQHGGQSIPNFDYSLADGVKKTFFKLYCDNIVKAISLTTDTDCWTTDKDGNPIYIPEIQSAIEESKKLRFENGLPSIDSYDYWDYNHTETEFWRSFFETKLVLKSEDFEAQYDKITEDIENIQYKARQMALYETDRKTFQAMESLVHNLNTMHSRAGAQTPFSSINYGTDTTPEGRMVIKNVLLALEKGMGNGETPIFPIHIFRVKEGINFNPGDANYDLFKLACRVSAKRLFPNFAFQDAPFNLQYYKEGQPETEISYMGCRTRVMANVNGDSTTYGRGNLSFTSINLPRLALMANRNVDVFFS